MTEEAIPLFQIAVVPVDTVTDDPENPRKITDSRFADLKKQMRENPWYVHARPVIVDANGVAKAGNQRLKAAIELGWKFIPVIEAEKLTEEQLEYLVLADNNEYGQHDWTALNRKYTPRQLMEWGIVEWKEPPKSMGQKEFEPTFLPSTSHREVSEDDMQKAQERLGTSVTSGVEKVMIDVICPECAHEFSILKNG